MTILLFFIFCSITYAVEARIVTIGRDVNDTLYTVRADGINQTKDYIVCEYLIQPSSAKVIDYLVETSGNPNAVAAIMLIAFSNDFKYRQALAMYIVDSKINTLADIEVEFNKDKYIKIESASMEKKIADVVKNILKNQPK